MVRQLRGPTVEDVGVVEQAIEERGDCGGVAEELAPVVHWPIGRQQRTVGQSRMPARAMWRSVSGGYLLGAVRIAM